MNSFRLMYLLILMLEYQLKAACMSSFMSLQKKTSGTTQQLTSLNYMKQKILTGQLDINCAEITFFHQMTNQTNYIRQNKTELN